MGIDLHLVEIIHSCVFFKRFIDHNSDYLKSFFQAMLRFSSCSFNALSSSSAVTPLLYLQ